MTAFSAQDNTARTVKDAAQLVDIIGEVVALKRAGVNLKGLCPFHSEKTPSFTVSPERQTFHCFGCNEGGDVFTFMMKYHRMTFQEALQELARRYHILLPEKTYSPADQEKARRREMLFEANNRTAAVYHEFLLQDPGAANARAYLEKRGIPLEMIKEFQIGYAPDSWDFLGRKISRADFPLDIAVEAGLLLKNDRGGHYDRFRDRVLFPIFDLSGKIAGFGGRILGDGQPKYLNSPETPVFDKSRILFGLYQCRHAIRQQKRCVIVEGNFDLLSLVAHGINYVVAPLGTALTQGQVRILKGYTDEVILLFDGDEAGLKAALRAVPIFLAEKVSARIAVLPPEHDPDTFVSEVGREGLEGHLAGAMPLLEFVFDRLVDKFGLTLEGKGRILNELRPLIETAANDPMQKSVLISHFSERLQIDPEQVLRGFQESRQPQADSRHSGLRQDEGDEKRELVLSRIERDLLEFVILYPLFLDRFLEKGISRILREPQAAMILDKLQELAAAEATPAPEQLLDLLPEGPEKSFVSGLLVAAPTFSRDENDDMLERVAEEKLAWLEKTMLIQEIATLTGKIEEAREAGDDEQLFELIRRKTVLNQAVKATAGGEAE